MATSSDKRVSGYGASHLRQNPRYARTSDTRQPLGEITVSLIISICAELIVIW
jgi:hypothetical protein